MYNFRTDLALERNDIYKKQNNLSSEIDGIEVNEESKEMSFLEYESPYSKEEKAKEPSKEEKKES